MAWLTSLGTDPVRALAPDPPSARRSHPGFSKMLKIQGWRQGAETQGSGARAKAPAPALGTTAQTPQEPPLVPLAPALRPPRRGGGSCLGSCPRAVAGTRGPSRARCRQPAPICRGAGPPVLAARAICVGRGQGEPPAVPPASARVSEQGDSRGGGTADSLHPRVLALPPAPGSRKRRGW